MKWNQLNEANAWETYWEKISNDCKPYLIENPDFATKALFRGLQQGRDDFLVKQVRSERKPKDTSPAIQKKFDEYLHAAGMPLSRSNSIFCSGDTYMASNFGAVYVIFPIGNFKFAWNPNVYDLTEMFINGQLDSVIIDSDEEDLNLDMFTEHAYSIMDKMAYRNDSELPDMPFFSPNQLAEAIGRNISDSTLYLEFSKIGIMDVDSSEIENVANGYLTENLDKAIDSNCEIMVRCDSYYAVSPSIFKIIIEKLDLKK